MATSKLNNLLVYLGPLDDVASLNDVNGAVGVFSRFDHVIVGAPTWGNAPSEQLLERVLDSTKAAKPSIIFHAYNDYGVDGSTLAAQIASWSGATYIAPHISSLAINNFHTPTRVAQNTLIADVHTAGFGLTAMQPAGTEYEILEQLSAEVASTLGMSATRKDYLVMEGLVRKNEDLPAPTAEALAVTIGRLAFVAGKQIASATTTVTYKNFGVLTLMGAGQSGTVNEAEWKSFLNQSEKYRGEAMGIVNFDRGSASKRYFLDFRGNVFRA